MGKGSKWGSQMPGGSKEDGCGRNCSWEAAGRILASVCPSGQCWVEGVKDGKELHFMCNSEAIAPSRGFEGSEVNW